MEGFYLFTEGFGARRVFEACIITKISRAEQRCELSRRVWRADLPFQKYGPRLALTQSQHSTHREAAHVHRHKRSVMGSAT